MLYQEQLISACVIAALDTAADMGGALLAMRLRNAPTLRT